MKKFAVFFILFLFTPDVFGLAEKERDNFRIERLSLEEGIAHNMVFSIVQDQRGFIWIGTALGLIKYDGNRYTNYRTSIEDTNSLSNDDITTIIEDSEGRLWIGTYSGGLNIYDKDAGLFTRLDVEFFGLGDKWNGLVWSLAEDTKGNIWVGTLDAGVIKINKSTLQFKIYMSDQDNPASISVNAISKILTDKNGEVWLGSNDGILHRYNSTKDNFTRFTELDNGRQTSFAVITVIFEGRENVFWVGTEKGLYVFDKKKNKYLSSGDSEFSALTGELINCVYEDRSGRIWIGSGNGLHVFDSKLKLITHLKHVENDPHSLSSDVVVAVYEDMSGVVWVGTYLGGVDKIYVNQDKFNLYRKNAMLESTFSDNHIFDISEDEKGIIWLATNRGLNSFNKEKNEINIYSSVAKLPGLLSSDNVRSLAVDKDNNLWIGTNNGLDKLNLDSKKISHYKYNFLNRFSLSDNRVTEILVDRKGTVWVGTFKGLNKYYSGSDEFIRYLPGLMEPSTKEERIESLFEDKEGNIWIGTNRGLFMKKPLSDEMVSYRHDPKVKGTLSHNYIYSIHESQKGDLWLGTGGGLNKFLKQKNSFVYYDENHGLPDRVIKGILEDDKGFLYLSTNKGLSRFDPETETFVNYDIGDGLQSNMFVDGAYLKRKNGEMLFGGINGFNSFFPSKLKPKSFVPPIYITSIKRFDEQLKFDKEITAVKEIILDYSDNFITFEFAALDYVNPAKIDYAYRLIGIDDKWVYSGNTTKASYTNLPPGDYIFEVKATNSDKIWSDRVLAVSLIITPPFWRTWWFNSLLVFLLVGIFYLVHKLRVKSELRKAMEIEEVRLQENESVRKKAADDFHDELGYRLTKISLYAEILKKDSCKSEEEKKEYLEHIGDITKSLSHGVRDFIWTLDPVKDTLYDTIIRLKDFGDDLFDKTGIAFRVKGISHEFENVKLNMDWRRQITLIYKEAMNNVLKYSGAENVLLEFSFTDDLLKISLQDDGKGFDIVKESRGRGLRNIVTRAKNINCKAEILSLNNQGTTVLFEGRITI